MTTKEIRAILDEQRAAQAKYQTDIEDLQSSGKYSAEYIAAQRAKLDSDYATGKATRSAKAADALAAYKAQIRGKVDLADPVLSNFIALTSAMGENTPRAIMDSAVDHFRGNNTALKAISSIIKQNGIEYSTAERFIVDEDGLDAAILEAKRDIDRNSTMSPIGLALEQIDYVDAQQIEPEPVTSNIIPKLI